MATFTAIKNRGGGRGALGGVLRYTQQDEKTLWEGQRLVSGWNCTAQSARSEMQLTKERFRKTDGRQYYHFVQSFAAADDLTPQEALAIGLELAQREFPDFEVLVATHIDTDKYLAEVLWRKRPRLPALRSVPPGLFRCPCHRLYLPIPDGAPVQRGLHLHGPSSIPQVPDKFPQWRLRTQCLPHIFLVNADLHSMSLSHWIDPHPSSLTILLQRDGPHPHLPPLTWESERRPATARRSPVRQPPRPGRPSGRSGPESLGAFAYPCPFPLYLARRNWKRKGSLPGRPMMASPIFSR